MDFHIEDLIVSIINIIVLAALLRLILWKPVSRFLAERAERVRGELESADKARAGAEELRQKYEGQLEDLRSREDDLMRGSKAAAEAETDRMLKEAKEKADNMINDARERIEEEKRQAIAGARHEVAQIATEMAAQILRREVSPIDNRGAAEDFFDGAR